jgi:maleate cis-trans isomerase
MTDLQNWDQAAEAAGTISTATLDAIANEYNAAWDAHATAKAIESELRKAAEEMESKLISALEQAGKQKYFVEGMGTFSFSTRMSVQTPKTIEQKQLLAKYLEEHGGKALFWSTFGVNSNTLQAFYKAEFEAHQEQAEQNGTAEPFNIPGLDAPTAMKSLRLTKERSKS